MVSWCGWSCELCGEFGWRRVGVLTDGVCLDGWCGRVFVEEAARPEVYSVGGEGGGGRGEREGGKREREEGGRV